QRIELQRLGRCVNRDDECAAERLKNCFALNERRRAARRRVLRSGTHALTSRRSALVTAFRTIGLVSSVAFSRAARDAGEPTLPRAIAAQARISGDCFCRRMFLPLSILSSIATLSPVATAPKASKKAIFSVRSASFRSPKAASRRARAG